jgi:ankyrin repeat protein
MARQNVELVRYFLDRGANTGKLDTEGRTLLHFASKVGMINLWA